MMRAVGLVGALLTTVRAACSDTCWVPKSGDTVQKAADALGVELDTFKGWNPDLKDPDKIRTTDVFVVSSVGPLQSAMWTTSGSTTFLHLGVELSCETPVASGLRGSIRSNNGATTIETSFVQLPTSKTPCLSSTSESEDATTATPLTSTIAGALDTDTSTTGSFLTHESTTVSATPSPLCGGSEEDPPLFCNPVNDGTFFTDGSVVKKLAREFCSNVGGHLLPSGGVRLDQMDDPHKSHAQHEVVVELFRDCDNTEDRRVPAGRKCEDLFYRNFEECGCNGGTGGASVLNGCLGLRNQPKHRNSLPKLAAYEFHGKTYVRKYEFVGVDSPA